MRKAVFFLALGVTILKSSVIYGQVRLQTGAAEYSIPLYSYSDQANRIGTSLSLIYTAGNGLKVSEVASSVGTGWELSSGGFIQRIQHGEPDDQKNSSTYAYPPFLGFPYTTVTEFHNWVDSYYPNGYLYSEYSPSTLIDNGAGYTPMRDVTDFKYKPHPKYMADLEQDVFSFNFNGQTGYFIIGKKDQNNVYPIRTLYDSKLIIEKVDGDLNNTNNIRTTISEFRITDENGIKYVFKDANLDQVCKYDKDDMYNQYGVHVASSSPYTNQNGGYSSIYSNPFTGNFNARSANTVDAFVKNKWYLSEIINPLTNVKIQFVYEDYNFDISGNKTAQQSTSANKTTFSLVIERMKGIAKRLKRIVLSPKESVEFTYSTSSRIDIPTDKFVESIGMKYDDAVKYKWDFEYGYFVKNEIKPVTHNFSVEEQAWSRLCLQKIKKTGTNSVSEPPYLFSYYMGNESDILYSAVPPMFSFYQDISGYYNVLQFGGFYNPGTQTSAPTNAPYEPYGGNLLPKSLYEASWAAGGSYKRPTLEARNGILKSVTNPLGGIITYTYEPHYFNISTSQGRGGVRVGKTSVFDGLDHNKDIVEEYKYIKADGSTSAWGFDSYVYSRNSNLRVYQKCGNQIYPSVSASDLALGIIPGIISSGAPLNLNTLRFATQAAFNQVSSNVKETIKSVIINLIINLVTAAYEDHTVSEFSSESYISNNSLPFQYSRVKVVNKLSTDNIGETVYEFTSPSESLPEFAIDYPSLSEPFSGKQRYAYWLYGLTKQVTVYDKYEKFVKKTENYYKPYKYSLSSDPKFQSQKWLANKKVFDCPFAPQGMTGTNDVFHDLYYPICGRVELEYTKEYIYNDNDPQEFAVTQTNYEYSTNNYQVKKISKTNSKGENIETNTYYPHDYTLSGILQTMTANNLVNIPVSSQTLITKSGSQKYLLSGGVSEFDIASNGDIKTVKEYSFRSDMPVASASVPFSATQLIPSTTYYKEVSSVSYNSGGNTVQVNTEKGKACTIYDYEDKLPVANVTNAAINEVAYTSFETAGFGGWELVTGSAVSNYGGITGKRAFSGTVRKLSLPSGNYTVTLWSVAGGSPTVNTQAGILLMTIGNWQLYEWKLTNITSVQVVATNIDELRLLPTKARMATAVYDPLIGKTAECDASNRITYYDYDELGRIKMIRDENRNVLKAYEYNYKQ